MSDRASFRAEKSDSKQEATDPGTPGSVASSLTPGDARRASPREASEPFARVREPPPSLASVLPQVAFRCALFGLVFTTVSLVLFGLIDRFSAIEPLAVPLTLFNSGLALVPATALELIAKRWPTSWRRDVLAFGAAVLVGPASFTLALVQAFFSYSFVRSGSYSTAAQELEGFTSKILEPDFFMIAFALGVVVAPVVVARLREASLLKTLAIALVHTTVISAPITLVAVRGGGSERLLFAGFAYAAAIGLPLAAVLGDRVEAIARKRWVSA